MKVIMIGNQYVGYKPIGDPIMEYAIYFPASTSPKDLEDWLDNAKHGDILELPSEGFKSFIAQKRHLLCIDL